MSCEATITCEAPPPPNASFLTPFTYRKTATVAPTAKSSASATTRPRDLMEMSPFGNPLSLRHLPGVSLALSSVASHEPEGQEPFIVGSQSRIAESPKLAPPPGLSPPIWTPFQVTSRHMALLFAGGGPH